MAKNVQASLAKYKRNAGAATEEWMAGVQTVTTPPTQKAAQAVDKYARGVQDAVSSGAYVNGCNAVTLQDWQAACSNKGKRNYANGVNNLSPKAVKNQTDQLIYAEQVKQEIAAMPNNGPEDARARMNACFEKMSAYKKRMG